LPKTGGSRDIYVYDEATHYLKQWIDWKYNNNESSRDKNDNDLVFTARLIRIFYM